MWRVKVTEPTEAQLHLRMLARDEQAFALWSDRLFPYVFAMLRKKGLTKEEAEDAAQEAFFRTCQRLFEEPPLTPLGLGPRKYLFAAARNRRADVLEERAKRGQTVDPALVEHLLRAPDEPEEVEPEETPALRKLRECLAKAPERHAKILRLYYLEFASTKEIAAAFNIKPGSAYETRARAERWLSACMEGEAKP